MDHPPEPNSSTFAPDTGPAVDWVKALDEHRSSLRNLVASKLNGEGEAAVEDVLQEVAMAAQSLEKRAVEPSRVGPWLRQVAMHKIHDHWRSKGRRHRLHTEFAEGGAAVTDPAPSPYEWVVRLEQSQSVMDALRGLSEEDRTILEQKHLHGRSYEEIARAHGITMKALEYRLSRARTAMRRRLKSHPEACTQRPTPP